jgi:hypothetical protein
MIFLSGLEVCDATCTNGNQRYCWGKGPNMCQSGMCIQLLLSLIQVMRLFSEWYISYIYMWNFASPIRFSPFTKAQQFGGLFKIREKLWKKMFSIHLLSNQGCPILGLYFLFFIYSTLPGMWRAASRAVLCLYFYLHYTTRYVTSCVQGGVMSIYFYLQYITRYVTSCVQGGVMTVR